MNNIVNRKQLEHCAEEIVAIIPSVTARARMRGLFLIDLKETPGNFRRARAADIAGAGDWACEALATGGELNVFVQPSPTQIARLKRIAAEVSAAIAEAAIIVEPWSFRDADRRRAERQFVSKLNRMALADIARQAFDLGRRRTLALNARARSLALAKAIERLTDIPATNARRWRMLASPSELFAAGETLDNCLRRERQGEAYAARLLEQTSRFWLLEDAQGRALACVRVQPRERFIEEKAGPGNARIRLDDPDLACLCRAQNLRLRVALDDSVRAVPQPILASMLALLEEAKVREET